MKKNTNTRYKVNNTFADITITLILLILAAVCLRLFALSYYRTNVRDDKNKIANITFKKNTVQRKNNDSTTWDRPKTHADIYDGDTIATSSKSQACILTYGQNKILISDNTLIQLYLDKDGKIILDLSTGKIKASTVNTHFTIKCGQEKILVGKNTSVTTSKTQEYSSIIVNSGKAIFIDKKQNLSRLKEKENIQITDKGEIKKNKIDVQKIVEEDYKEFEEYKKSTEENSRNKNKNISESQITAENNSEDKNEDTGVFIDESPKEETTKTVNTQNKKQIKNPPVKTQSAKKIEKKNNKTQEKKENIKANIQADVKENNKEQKNKSTKVKEDTNSEKQSLVKEKIESPKEQNLSEEKKQEEKKTLLKAVELISPKEAKVWTWDEILDEEESIFKFKSVKNANDYIFKITENASGSTIYEKIIKAQDKKEVSLSLFDTFENSGEYTWTVTARIISNEGNILEESEKSSRTFTLEMQSSIIDALDGVKQTEIYADVNTN